MSRDNPLFKPDPEELAVTLAMEGLASTGWSLGQQFMAIRYVLGLDANSKPQWDQISGEAACRLVDCGYPFASDHPAIALRGSIDVKPELMSEYAEFVQENNGKFGIKRLPAADGHPASEDGYDDWDLYPPSSRPLPKFLR